MGVNGYISDSREDLLNALDVLLKDLPLIQLMKKRSRQKMEKDFSKELVLNDFTGCIFQESN